MHVKKCTLYVIINSGIIMVDIIIKKKKELLRNKLNHGKNLQFKSVN